jgi:hypothetical protein
MFSADIIQGAGTTLTYFAHLQNKTPPFAPCPPGLQSLPSFFEQHCPNLANLAQLSYL